MLTAKQLSVVEHIELIGRARYGVDISPSQVADRFRLKAERIVDELDYYDVFILDFLERRIAFRMYINSPKKFSYVTVIPEDDRAVELINEVIGIDGLDVIRFSECW